jgi:hypothetical protein
MNAINNDLDYSKLKEDDTFLMNLGHSVWLMDNHRWAFLVWEQNRQHESYLLVHADQHWDSVDDFALEKQEKIRLLHANADQIKQYVVDNKYIRFDSFIAPAIRRNMIDEVHFYCTQKSTDMGLDENLLIEFCTEQIIHPNINSLATAVFKKPIIFDLCLDLFNSADDDLAYYEGDLWSDSEILDFLKSIQHIIKEADIVTISISFGYSGSYNDSRHLTQLVCPVIMEYRAKS